MKTNIDRFEILFIGIVIGVFIGTLISVAVLYETTHKQSNTEADMGPTIIWNEDDEGIPADGELVRIEMTKNDTIYICNK